ncbi:MAG: hypothetical protein ACRC3B_16605 [Bacteroidia bacterium]
MKIMLRLLLCFVLCLPFSANAQFYFGYRAGMYSAAEIPPQIYAAKFNAGWEFSELGDGALIFFEPGTARYKIDNNIEWGNLPHGINLGLLYDSGDNLGLQLGFYQFNQRSSGKRTNLSTGVEEKFSMQSKSGGITFNVFYDGGRFKPYIGTDMGVFRLRYSFSNDVYDIKKQKLGYNIGLLGSGKKGDNVMMIRFNFGTYIRLLDLNSFSLQLVPQYQMGIKGFEEINRLPYEDLLFDHRNWSLGLVFTLKN